MNPLGGRGGRSDDWSSPHERAQARAAERLAFELDETEARWLEDHLAGCAECSAVDQAYATQRIQLRALRDRQPPPPRDLWARTAAAIEREGTHRPRRRRSARSLIAPYAVLAGALVVAVVVVSLPSSQPLPGTVTTTPGTSVTVAVGSPAPSAGPTPLLIAPRDVAYLSSDGSGYRLNTTRVDRVCPADSDTCAPSRPNVVVDIGPLSSPATVYGSGDQLVIVGDDGSGSNVVALDLAATHEPAESPTAETPAPTESGSPAESTSPPIAPSDDPGTSANPTVEPTVEPSASPDQGAVEIARGVEVVAATAAYAPDGSAFAFTARPADGSSGPNIYVWRVGDAEARLVTTDGRSVFGSWAGSSIVGSTVDPATGEPRAFVLADGTTEPALRPETGLVWQPVVDPTGGSAVYWSGTLEPTDDGTAWLPAEGRLVIGRWGGSTTDEEAQPTPLAGDQASERSETPIAEGPLTTWDVRWDETGERLAVWIADPDDPSVGRLSLYVVDPFDGRIDLTHPPLADEPALAGISMADGRLAWASPAGNSDKASRVLVLAWTDEGFGQVESAPGDFILVQ